MQNPGPTEMAISRLKNGTPVTKILQETRSPTLGDYLFEFLCKTNRST